MFDAPRMSFLRLSTLLTFLLSWSWCLPTNQRSVMSVLANQRPVLIALTNQRSVANQKLVLSVSANQKPLLPGLLTGVDTIH